MQQANMLGTTIELRIVGVPLAEADTLFAELWKQVTEFNSRFSRFLPESELSRFNQSAGSKTAISKPFEALLLEAKRFAVLTEGIFNPFILPALQRNGYVHSIESPRTDTPIFSQRHIVSYTELEIGSGWAHIPKNTAIDLGGIGKGYLADRLGQHLSKHTEHYCLDIGGDMIISGRAPDGPWEIDIASLQDTSLALASYTNADTSSFGIATSGTVRTRNGKKQTHIIDPRKGELIAKSELQCTIIAPDAVSADVLASCVLIDSIGFAERLLAAGHIQAVLLQAAHQDEPVILGEGFTLNKTKHAELSTYV